MALKNFKKDKDAVSEIIGTLLMISITVTLFASLAYFVQTLPPPQDSTVARFSQTYQDGWLNITHEGGESLPSWGTMIYAIKDGGSQTLSFWADETMGVPMGETWGIGETWSQRLDAEWEDTLEEVWIVDTVKATLVWSTSIVGTDLELVPPLIVDRWADPDPTTSFRETIYVGDTVYLMCRIVDPNTPPSEQINVTATTGRTSVFEGTLTMYPASTAGVYYAAIPGTATRFWDGATITFTATNEQGSSTARYSMSVRVITQEHHNETTIIVGEGEDYYGEGGLPGHIININFRQGYDIFKGTQASINHSQPTRSFDEGDWVWIEVASWDLYSPNMENTFILTNSRGSTFTPPTSYTAFQTIQTNPYIFRYKFDANLLKPGGIFPITIRMRDDQQNSFYTFDTITFGDVEDEGGMKTYRDQEYTIRDKNFSSTDIVHVDMEGNYHGDIAVQGVTISDFYGNTQVRGAPSTDLMDYIADSGNQRFWIDLRYANQDPWQLGNQTYALRVGFTDDIDQYVLTKLIRVEAPRNRQDFLVGTTGIGSGHGNFARFDHLFWIKNNNFFTMDYLEGRESTPGNANPLDITAIAFGDLDGDGDLDILACVEERGHGATPTRYHLGYYENRKREIGRFEDMTSVHRPDNLAIRAIAIGDATGDGVNDFAVGTSGGLVFYHNTYGVPYQAIAPAAGSVNTIVMENVLNITRGRAEIIVGSSTGLHVYENIGTASAPSWYQAYTVAGEVLDLVVGDVSGNERPDIAVLRAGVVTIHPNTAEGLGEGMDSIDSVAEKEHPFLGDILGTFESTTTEGGIQTLKEEVTHQPGGSDTYYTEDEIQLIGEVFGEHTLTNVLDGTQELREYMPGDKFAQSMEYPLGTLFNGEVVDTWEEGGSAHVFTEQPTEEFYTYYQDADVTLLEEDTNVLDPEDEYTYVSVVGTPKGTATNPENLESNETGLAVFTEGESVGGGAGEKEDEIRYMRADGELGTAQTGATQSGSIQTMAANGNHNQQARWGIRVWAGGSEVTGGAPVAVVSRNGQGAGMQSSEIWACQETEITDTDEVVVRVYSEIVGHVAWTEMASFKTDGLGAIQLDGEIWRVYYHTEHENLQGGPNSRTEATFSWGAAGANSRIENFTYSVEGEGDPIYEGEFLIRIDDIPDADRYVLEYSVSGDLGYDPTKFQLQLSDDGNTYSIVNELPGANLIAGSHSREPLTEIFDGSVYLRLVGLDNTTEHSVALDYIRVRAVNNSVYRLETVYDITPPEEADEYTITVSAISSTPDESFLVEYSISGGAWSSVWDDGDGAIISVGNTYTYAFVRDAGFSDIRLRFTDNRDDDSAQASLTIDYMNVTGFTPPGMDLDVRYTFELGQKPMPGDVFDVSIKASYSDGNAENCRIFAWDWTGEGSWPLVPVETIAQGPDYNWYDFTLGPEYVSDDGEVRIRFRTGFQEPGEPAGTLSIDYMVMRYLDNSTLLHTWHLAVDPGEHTVHINASRITDHDVNFTFYWSTDQDNWNYMFTVANDTAQYYNYTSDLLNATSGDIYIKVENNGSGAEASTLFVNHIYIHTTRADLSYTSMDHVWEFNIPAGATPPVFTAYAWRDDNLEEDDFEFYWSTDKNGPWAEENYMFTVDRSNREAHPFELPDGVSGPVFIRAVNTNQDLGKTTPYSLYVEWMYFTIGIGEITGPLDIADSDGYNAIGVGDINKNGNLDISVAKNGEIRIFENTDPSQSVHDGGVWQYLDDFVNPSIRFNAGDARQSFIMADMNGNGYADFVTSGNVDGAGSIGIVYLWLNLGDNTYRPIIVRNLNTEVRGGPVTPGDIRCIAVGPTDGWTRF